MALSLPGGTERRQLRVDGLHRWLLVEREAEGPCLVKQLLPHLAREPGARDRWLEIAQRNATLDHASCPSVLEWGREGEGAFVISRYPSGQPLRALVRAAQAAEGAFSAELAVHVACSVLDVLAYVHEREPTLLHLDLDPDGLLVRPDGTLLLPEFGLWTVLSPAELARCRFDSGRVQYSSPEMVQATALDARSDVFSAGVLLYELLTGAVPFAGATQLLTAMAIAEGTRRPVDPLMRGAPPGLADILEAMLATRPEERFQSARAAQNALLSTLSAPRPELARQLAARCGAPAHDEGAAPLWAARTVADMRAIPDPRALAQGQAAGARPALTPADEHAAAAPPPLWGGAASVEEARPAGLAVPAESARAPLQARTNEPVLPPLVLPPLDLSSASAQATDLGEVAPPPLLLPAAGATPEGSPHGAPLAPALAADAFPAWPASATPELPERGMPVHDGRTSYLKAAPRGPESTSASGPAQPPLSPFSELPSLPQLQPPQLSPLPDLPLPGGLGSWPTPAPPTAFPAHATSSPGAAPADLAAGRPAKWRDPSPTLFQVKARGRNAPSARQSRTPWWTIVGVSLVFGFAAVVGIFLLYRLLQ